MKKEPAFRSCSAHPARAGPENTAPTHTPVSWGSGVAALLSSPGPQNKPFALSSASGFVTFDTQAESEHPASREEVTCFLTVSAGVSGTIGQRDSVGRDP